MRKHRGWRHALVVVLAGFAGASSMAAECALAERVGTLQAKARPGAMTAAQYSTSALFCMQHVGVVEPRLAAREAPLVARSNARATADCMGVGMAADYRPGLQRANMPILEISSCYAPDFAVAAAASRQPVTTEAQKSACCRGLLSNAPDARVVSIPPSRHFAMFDQPAKFQRTLDDVLKSL